ncbi:MAG: universal stress protein [Pseudomonadota bacterium]
MASIKKILALVNPRRDQHAAAERAAMLAASMGAELRLHGVTYEPAANFDLFHLLDRDHAARGYEDEAREKIEALAKELTATGVGPINVTTTWRHPFDRGVLDAVEADWPDLVLLEAREPDRLSQAEWRVLHQCEVPVWLVRSRPWPDPAEIAACVDPAHRSSARSQADREVLSWTKAVQDLGSVHVLHALHDLPEAKDETVHAEYLDQLKADRRAKIEKLAEPYLGAAPTLEMAAVEPDEMMRAFAQRENAGLVVMGVFSRSRLADLLIGSTARRVLPDLPCDVLTVPADR